MRVVGIYLQNIWAESVLGEVGGGRRRIKVGQHNFGKGIAVGVDDDRG